MMLRKFILLLFASILITSKGQELIFETQFELPKSQYKAGIQKVCTDTAQKKVWISFMPEKVSLSEENPHSRKKFELVLNEKMQIASQQYSPQSDNRPVKVKYAWKNLWIGTVIRTNNQTNPNQRELVVIQYDQKGNLFKEQSFALCPAKQLEKYNDILVHDTLFCFYEKEISTTERTVEILKINLNNLNTLAQKPLTLPNSRFGLFDVRYLQEQILLWSAEVDLQKFGSERVPHKNTLFSLNTQGEILNTWNILPDYETDYLQFSSDKEKNIYVLGEYTKSKSHDDILGIFIQKLESNGKTAWAKQYDYKGELQKSIRTSSTGSMLYTQGGVLLHKLFCTDDGELIVQAELFTKRQYSNTNFNNNSMFMGGIGGSFADPYTDYEYFDILLMKFDKQGNYIRTERIPRTRQVKTYTGHLFSRKPVEKSYIYSQLIKQHVFLLYMNIQHNGKYHYLYACKYNTATGQIVKIADLSTDGFEVMDNFGIQNVTHNQAVVMGTNSKGNLLWVKELVLE